MLKKRLVSILLVFLLVLSGCGQRQALLINGAGASFPYPIYSRWIAEYGKVEKGVKINYQSIGSGAGIQQITAGVIDFGGSDAPMSDEQLKLAPGEILHIPTVLGAVAVIYNLPDMKGKLKITPAILADIYLGRIKKWNDPSLLAVNPGLKLPDSAILVVHRSDGSGTTSIFTDYLSTVSPEWKQKVGKGTSVQWPVGIGGKGNEGVSKEVQSSAASIGYVELAYALLNNLEYAGVQNKAGKFIGPSLESTTAAAAGAVAAMPEDLRVSIVDPPGEDAYPIAGFTYILVYKEQADPAKGKAVAEFLWWAVHEGEKLAAELHYAPLPPEVVKKAEEKLKSINYQGKALLAN